MNLSNGGGDTAPEEPIPDANPELKDAAPRQRPTTHQRIRRCAGDVKASDSDFPCCPTGLLSPAGICGGRKPPIAEPADGIPRQLNRPPSASPSRHPQQVQILIGSDRAWYMPFWAKGILGGRIAGRKDRRRPQPDARRLKRRCRRQ